MSNKHEKSTFPSSYS